MEKVTQKSLKELFSPIYLEWVHNEYSNESWYDPDESEEYVDEGWREFILGGDSNIKESLKTVDLELITSEGGGEGGTEDCFTIIKYKDEFYKLTYWYRSHHGYDGLEDDDFVKVTPKKIEVIVYK